MADIPDGSELHPVTIELAGGRNVAGISTLPPDGRIQTQYIWVGTDGDRLCANSEPHRQMHEGRPSPAAHAHQVTVWSELERQTIAGWGPAPRAGPAMASAAVRRP